MLATIHPERFETSHRTENERRYVVVFDRVTGETELWPDYHGVSEIIRGWMEARLQNHSGRRSDGSSERQS
jgi:hypothetical protein